MSHTLGIGCRALLLATAVSFGIAASWPALADPPEWAGVWRVKHKHHGHYFDDDDVRVIYVPQTTVIERRYVPAPPARAYRAPVARGLPYGFNRGTCDRSLVSGELVGNVLGGVAGGVLGSQVGRGTGRTAATIGGTLVGVMVGGSVGRSMDGIDQGCVAGALDYLPDNRPIAWRGDEGETYRVVPTRSWHVDDQRYCREYQAAAVIGGRRQQTYGTACRQPDGSWEIVD